MRKNRFLLLLITPLLIGCGSKSVNYEAFHELALEASEKNPYYKTAMLNGSHTIGETRLLFDMISYTFQDGEIISSSDDTYEAVLGRTFVLLRAKDVVDFDEYKYTVSNKSFLVTCSNKDLDMRFEYDKYGYITSAQYTAGTTSYDFIVKWSK